MVCRCAEGCTKVIRPMYENRLSQQGRFSYTGTMQIAVFGASGKVGRLVVQQALQRGFRVVAFVHSHNPFAANPNLTISTGDIYKADDVARAINGSEAVVSCLGSWGTPRRDVLSSAMERIIPAMQAQGVERIVTLTGIGVQAQPSTALVFGLRLLQWLPAGKVFADAEKHVQMLAASDLVWTTICSPVINKSPKTAYYLKQKGMNPLRFISRAAVATALLDQLSSKEFLRQTVVIYAQRP